MSKIGDRLIMGVTEALAIAKGEEPAARITVKGFHYVPEIGWRSIGSAPKDGSEVLLYANVPPVFEHYIVLGTYAADVGRKHLSGWEADGEFFPDGQFTHWMPLPAPPVVRSKP